MLFKRRPKIDMTDSTQRLRVEMVQVLHEHGFTWDQIFHAIGFSETWFNWTRQYLESKSHAK